MQRYFAKRYEKDVVLTKDDAFHLTKVMRARVDDQIEVVADDKLFICDVKSIKPLQIKIRREVKENNELRCNVILITSLLKGDHTDLVVQKATELGVGEIIFLVSERTIIRFKDSEREKKLERYSRIAKEAAEQSKRLVIPNVFRLIKLDELKNIKADVKLIAYEEMQGAANDFAEKVSKLKDGKTIAIMVGPEGGYSKGEVDTAMYYGFKKISLGKRILRSETASLYALSVISNALEHK